MLIINADDWGRSAAETDAALRCFKAGRITSVSAMVFTQDSERAAGLAKSSQMDVGLHLNFSEAFTIRECPVFLERQQTRLVDFLMSGKYAQLVYNARLRETFRYSYLAQVEEFTRLYQKAPSHIDGHHHMHLCANVVFSKMIPAGVKMRPHFFFWPGEKSYLNIAYRRLINRWLARRHRLPDFFFDLTQCIEAKKFGLVEALAKGNIVELMTHPVIQREREYLLGDDFHEILESVDKGTYTAM